MLDIGWTELLVIAVVLIVVVGPKDLPPMLRAFGKMTANLRKMAGDFRTQFDQALREADMDEVRQTISDVQKHHPANALREAINPLREMGNEIRNDLQKATSTSSTEVSETASVDALLPEQSLSLPETPPIALAQQAQPVAGAAIAEPAKTVSSASSASASTPATPAKAAAEPTAAGGEAAGPVKRRVRKPAVKADAAEVAPSSTALTKPTRKSKALMSKPEAGLPVEVVSKPSRSRTKTSKAVVSVAPQADASAAKVSKPRTVKKPTTIDKDDA